MLESSRYEIELLFLKERQLYEIVNVKGDVVKQSIEINPDYAIEVNVEKP